MFWRDNLLRFSIIILPAFENKRSDGTDVATIGKYRFAMTSKDEILIILIYCTSNLWGPQLN